MYVKIEMLDYNGEKISSLFMESFSNITPITVFNSYGIIELQGLKGRLVENPFENKQEPIIRWDEW